MDQLKWFITAIASVTCSDFFLRIKVQGPVMFGCFHAESGATLQTYTGTEQCSDLLLLLQPMDKQDSVVSGESVHILLAYYYISNT